MKSLIAHQALTDLQARELSAGGWRLSACHVAMSQRCTQSWRPDGQNMKASHLLACFACVHARVARGATATRALPRPLRRRHCSLLNRLRGFYIGALAGAAWPPPPPPLQDASGKVPLHYATGLAGNTRARLAATKMLLGAGAAPDVLDQQGLTPIMAPIMRCASA